ncbi:hypothetical protein PHSC3_001232 [Chlamydiales bacterium STE3]|nr:hypothetical protein PHSC3_001232 [Chlamydiales bacterium STE3]
MNKPTKQKLCWNCEGSVATFIENCPYCGVYLSPEHQEELNFDLLKPPYPFTPSKEDSYQPPYASEEEQEEKKEESSAVKKSFLKFDTRLIDFVIPIVLLTIGSVFSLFALVLYLFEEKGLFTLQWDAENWYLYAGVAIPSLLLGCYMFANIQDDDETKNSSSK